VRIAENATDGHPFTFSVKLGDYTSPEVTAHYWTRKSLESALQGAGLAEICWIVPAPSVEGVEKHGTDFWTDLMRRPFELIVTCRKA
jgi:hypothetical protein